MRIQRDDQKYRLTSKSIERSYLCEEISIFEISTRSARARAVGERQDLSIIKRTVQQRCHGQAVTFNEPRVCASKKIIQKLNHFPSPGRRFYH